MRAAQSSSLANSYPQCCLPSAKDKKYSAGTLRRPTFRRATTSPDRASRRSKKSTTSATTFSHEDANWYLRLPEKLQRGQFSEEERAILEAGCQPVVLDAADEALCKLGRFSNRSEPSLQTLSSSKSSIASSALEDPSADMDADMMDQFRWLSDEDDLDLRLDDYHVQLADAVNSQSSKPSSRRPSASRPGFGRTLSLTNLTKEGRPSIDSKPPQSATSAYFPSFTLRSAASHKRSNSISNLIHRQPPVPDHEPTSAMDPEAKYYQDPEARLKLRVYLGSPQKFDEALEFGFPSLDHTAPAPRPSSRRPSTSSRPNLHPSKLVTFLDDDEKDIEADGDNATLADPDSPYTPHDGSYSRPSPSRSPHSMPRLVEPATATRPPMWHTATDPYAQGWAGNREMTLRMTLTRPDLRADDSILYPKEGKDPLALEDLPLDSGDGLMQRGKGAGRLGRFWKRISRPR